MTNRQYILIGITVSFFAFALLFDFFTQSTGGLDSYASLISTHLQESELKVDEVLEDQAFVQRQIFRAAGQSTENTSQDFIRLENLSAEAYTISIFRDSNLIYWTNNNAIPTSTQISKLPVGASTKLIRHSNGYYALKYKVYPPDDSGIKTILTAMIPIKYQYGIESPYLNNGYEASPNIPEEVVLSNRATDYPITSIKGNKIAYLLVDRPYRDKASQKLLLMLYIAGFIGLCISINSYAISLCRKYKPWVGAAFLLVSVFLLRVVTLHFEWSKKFMDLALFSRSYNTPVWSNSLGDLLINVILLLWIILFFQKELRLSSFSHLGKTTKFLLTSINSFAIVLALIMVANTFKGLAIDSGIIFNFENVFNLSTSSQLAIIAVLLLLMSLFLFSHRMMETNIDIGLSKNARLFALALAILASIPIMLVLDLRLPLIQMILFVMIFVSLFDLFIDTRSSNLTWLIGWLVIFAAFSSTLLFKYSNDKDQEIRLINAKALSVLRDSIAEFDFYQLHLTIKRDTNLSELVKPFPWQLNREAIKPPIENFFSDNNYLTNNYSYQLYVFNKYGQPAVADQSSSLKFLEQRMALAESTHFSNLKLYSDQSGYFTYLMQTEIPNHLNPDNPLKLIFEFKRREQSQARVYSELLKVEQFKNLKNLSHYEYAIFKDNLRVSGQGNYNDVFPYPNDIPPIGESRVVYKNKRSELIYHASKNIIVVIGKQRGGFIKPLSLFSFFFLLLVGATILLGIINTLIRAIPNILDFSVLRRPSLRNRIQVSMISLIIISFVIIGTLTIVFFRNEFDDYHDGRLSRKTKTILLDTHREIELLLAQTSGEIDISAISKIHRMDINIFDLNGHLIKSSGYDIFDKGIIAPVMDPIAFQALSKLGYAEKDLNESIGKIKYRAAYVPLKKPEGEIIAYLGLPYYSEQGKLRSEVTDFMGYIINAYAFLLMVAGGIAIAIANSITRPLDQIQSKLKQFQLGGRNEPLDWENKNDEIGTLIEEYNRMIHKLDDSAELLAQSEREGAWREMAKQVAHEIKNPLTPMKLSIQYLQHAYKSNPEDIEPLLKRVSGTLIEQIDNLAQIASEFSNFAKMPRAENSKIIINKLVKSVFDLFKEGDQKTNITLSLPDTPLCVYADKNHLMRVLNNLIKNASQAIPESRHGKIHISLYQEERNAIIRVCDNGVGISDSMRDKVFVPNFTTKSSGTGLGLAISKNIIESVDGQIYFQTKVGKGTDFFVKLPIVEVKAFEEV